MRLLLISLMLLVVSTSAVADQPGRAFRYELFSQNEDYLLISTPYSEGERTHLEKSVVYDKDSNVLFETDRYFPEPSYISNDGNYIAAIAYWIFTGNEDKVSVLEFNRRGDSLKTYYLKDLLHDYEKLVYSVSHTMWYKDCFVDADTLYVETWEEKVLVFPMSSGELVRTVSSKNFSKHHERNEKPSTKLKLYNEIEYPAFGVFPELVDGRSFRRAFREGFNFAFVSYNVDHGHEVLIGVKVDEAGSASVVYLKAETEGQENSGLAKAIRERVEGFKFKTNLNPFEQWTYYARLYMNDE